MLFLKYFARGGNIVGCFTKLYYFSADLLDGDIVLC